MRARTRTATLMVVIVGCIGAAIGAAFGLGGDDVDRAHIPSRAEIYTDGMTLAEIAEAASGQPGEIAPACPEEKTVDALKDAGIEFGPCDPAPEEGEPVRLPEEGAVEEPADEAEEVCPGTILSKGVDLTIQLPCAVGAEIVATAAVKVADAYCAEVTYIEKAGAPRRTETLCEGDVPAIGGSPVTGPKAAASGEHDDEHVDEHDDEDGHDHGRH